jgi:hypothetical protein
MAERLLIGGTMHNRSLVWLLVIVFGGALASTPATAKQASSGVEHVGQWAGTWDGSGSGEFELTLEKGKDGVPLGKVAVTTDQGNYSADLKGLSFIGKNMSATYDFPLDPSAEVSVEATFDGDKAKGTWSLRPKGGGTEVASGSFTVSRKSR